MRKGKMIKKLESAPIVKFLEDEDSNFQGKKVFIEFSNLYLNYVEFDLKFNKLFKNGE